MWPGVGVAAAVRQERRAFARGRLRGGAKYTSRKGLPLLDPRSQHNPL